MDNPPAPGASGRSSRERFHGGPGGRWLAFVAGSLLLAVPAAAVQDPPQEPAHEPTLKELQDRLAALEQQHEDTVFDLNFEIEGLRDEIAQLQAKGATTTRRSNLFNPGITVFGNFLARSDDTRVYVDDDPTADRVDDRFHLREFEVDFRAAIDPWADGVLIVAHEADAPGTTDTAIEEGYVTLKKLPVLDSAPGGLKVQVGRFRPGFGRFNQIHLHDLPQPSYPASLGNFLGPEGWIDDGVSGQFFLPSPSDTQTLEATAAVLNGGGMPIADGQDGSNLAVLGHVKWFADLGLGKNVEVGVSGLQSDVDHRLLGADATYKWKPADAGEWESFLIGGELFQADLNEAGLAGDPLGYYLWSQYQFSRNTYVGVRYDRKEELADSSMVTDTYGVYATHYTTEFLRLRLGAEHADSDVSVLDGRDTLMLEINLIFGSHPVEPYWVNR